MGEKRSKGFHFNVNVRTNTGSIARMANNEESFSRAMEIQERKREKIEEEQKRLEADKKAEEKAAPKITPEPVENDEGDPATEAVGSEDSSETPVIQDEAADSPETTAETPVTIKPATTKPSGGGVSGPTSRAGQFTPEELDAMRKRAKAHAAKVKASKL
jgi:hypothetical protein